MFQIHQRIDHLLTVTEVLLLFLYFDNLLNQYFEDQLSFPIYFQDQLMFADNI